MTDVVPVERITDKIYLLRGKKVLMDRDLAELYVVSTSALNKAVTRNIDRFPPDFMFRLTSEEFSDLKFHFGTSSWGGTRKLPRAFTEQGVAMLSSVLRSKRAIEVNIAIMRAFVKLREMLTTHKKLSQKLADLERRLEDHDEQFKIVFDAIRALMAPPEKPKRKIGFEVKEPKGRYGRRTKKKHS